MTAAPATTARRLAADGILLRVSPAAWGAALAASLLLAVYGLARGDASPIWFTAAVFATCGALWLVPRAATPRRRPLVSLFLLAFGLRLAAAVFFDAHANAGGDPFAGSPDAWTYDFWARRLVTAWSELRDLDLSAFDLAGRWDVGFHYLLGAVYAIFGESVLTGRVLGAFFGALAVVLLFLIARRVADESVAAVAGLLYAFWISSVVWATYSVLRDSAVWALLLGSVWLILRIVDGSRLAALGLLLSLTGLRTIRPYAAIFVVFGLAVAGLLALADRSRAAIRPALVLAGVVLASESVFLVSGFPNAARTMFVNRPQRFLLKPLDEASPEEVMSAREILASAAESPTTSQGPESDALAARLRAARLRAARLRATRFRATRPEASPAPTPFFGQSLPANTIRFFLSPPGWAPVPFGSGNIDNWHLPGMWLWYAVLPAAALGMLLSLRGGLAAKSLVLMAGFVCTFMILMGRGDAARQREMIVPLVLLCFAIGIRAPAQHRRRLLVAYAVYVSLMIAGIVYHRKTLRARGLAEFAAPPRHASAPAESTS